MQPIGVQFQGNIRTAPAWAGDFGGREHILPFPAKLDTTQGLFLDKGGVPVAVGASAIATATSITVAALAPAVNPSTVLIAQGNVLIPAGTTLQFAADGSKPAMLTADALYGATTLTVAPLLTALAGTETATFSRYGTVLVPSGTLVGRTFTERAANAFFGPAAVTDDEIFPTLFDNVNILFDNTVEMYRPPSVIKENYLPDYTALSTAANEVQTVAVDTIMSAGKIDIQATDSGGAQRDVNVAYNTSWTQTVADIQTALIAVLGTAAIACAVTNTHDMTITFSGTGYAGVAQRPVIVDISAATGPTKVSVTRTTPGGTPLLTKLRSLYRCILGTD